MNRIGLEYANGALSPAMPRAEPLLDVIAHRLGVVVKRMDAHPDSAAERLELLDCIEVDEPLDPEHRS